jgi:hypothetical protein
MTKMITKDITDTAKSKYFHSLCEIIKKYVSVGVPPRTEGTCLIALSAQM